MPESIVRSDDPRWSTFASEKVTKDNLESEYRKIIPPITPLPPKEEPRVEKAVKNRHVERIVLKVSAFLILAAASYISASYGYEYWIGRVPSHFVAGVFSVMIVGTLLLAPQFVVFLFRMGGKGGIASGSIILAVCIPVLAFSVMGNVSVQYARNGSSEASIEKKHENGESYARKKKELSQAVARCNDDLTIARNEWVRESQAPFEDAYRSQHEERVGSKKAVADDAATELGIAQKALRDLEESATNDTKSTRESFQKWIAGGDEKKENIVEFLMSFFPAVFTDVIAPLMLAVALFL